MRVLIAEADLQVAALMRRSLEAAGFSVDLCSSGAEATNYVHQGGYDALVLDALLPDRDGIAVLTQLRASAQASPVVLLSRTDSPRDRARHLELGADDSMSRPFDLTELIARIQAVLRRARGEVSPNVLRVGELTLDLVRREVRRQDETVELTNREFALLACLMRNPGEILSRPQLCAEVWNFHHDPGTNVVDVCVQRVRRKIESPGQAPVIETVRGVGYRLRVG
jgi:two-component system OmpR family response regulator